MRLDRVKRTRFDIAEAILAKTGSGATKDQLIEQVDLPEQTVEKHLKILVYMKFLEIRDGQYYTAGRGKTFLRIRRENGERNSGRVSERT